MAKRPIGSAFSPEIQALRAIAIALVLVFHFWPEHLKGGFIGVDVFFTISGFLITRHLLQEREKTGRIDLRAFWARRIRRLFPAALLVLVATLVATVVVLPVVRWHQVITQFWACIALVQNWVLGYSAVNYFNTDTAVSPLQHYWSLSVEEQFYLVWPVLLVLLGLLGGKLLKRDPLRLFIGVAIAIGVLSFAWSVYETDASQSFAYFSTLTHVWEFVIGGVLAWFAPRLISLAASRPRLQSPIVLGAMLVVGFLLIVGAAVKFTGKSLFPGWIAIIPITGAVLVLVASVLGKPGILRRILGFAPIRFVGDISYSLYLWHWPVVVFAGVLLGVPLSTVERIVLVALSVLLAWLTKIGVEDPVRRGQLARVRVRWTYGIAAVVAIASVAVSLVPYAGYTTELKHIEAISRQLDQVHAVSAQSCYGAAAPLQADPTSCPDSHILDPREQQVAPWLSTIAGSDIGKTWQVSWGSCPTALSTLAPCSFGAPSASNRIDVIGDSHGFQYANVVLPIAQDHHWAVSVDWEAGCGVLYPGDYIGNTGDTETHPGCVAWKKALLKKLETDPNVHTIVVSTFAQKYDRAGTVKYLPVIQSDFRKTFEDLVGAGKQVVVVVDTPRPDVNVPDCLSATKVTVDPCTTPLSAAVKDDPMADAARSITSPDMHVVDLQPLLCDGATCHSVVGGISAYRDAHHLTDAFIHTLRPIFEPLLVSLQRTAS